MVNFTQTETRKSEFGQGSSLAWAPGPQISQLTAWLRRGSTGKYWLGGRRNETNGRELVAVAAVTCPNAAQGGFGVSCILTHRVFFSVPSAYFCGLAREGSLRSLGEGELAGGAHVTFGKCFDAHGVPRAKTVTQPGERRKPAVRRRCEVTLAGRAARLWGGHGGARSGGAARPRP